MKPLHPLELAGVVERAVQDVVLVLARCGDDGALGLLR